MAAMPSLNACPKTPEVGASRPQCAGKQKPFLQNLQNLQNGVRTSWEGGLVYLRNVQQNLRNPELRDGQRHFWCLYDPLIALTKVLQFRRRAKPL